MEGITYIDHFIEEPDVLFHHLAATIDWDESMTARKTASFGQAYNYSQMAYPFRAFLPELAAINDQVKAVTGFHPNNCLINYYLDGKSKMGFHSDQTDILERGTGIAIVSLGATRLLRFRNIAAPENLIDYELTPGSLVYMTQEVQHSWQHAIPKSDTALRQVKPDVPGNNMSFSSLQPLNSFICPATKQKISTLISQPSRSDPAGYGADPGFDPGAHTRGNGNDQLCHAGL